MKKIKENISIIIIIGIIIITTFLIGTPLSNNNIQIVYIISGVLSIFYYIIKREKIIKDKIDICIIILAFSTLLPLIFNTYVTLAGTVKLVIRYFCILNLFLITKNECQKNSKYKHIILNTIIISILILCIIGLDEIGNNYLKEFKQFIGYNYIDLREIRIASLFSYANAMAAVAGIGIFLCLGYIFNSKKIKIKLIYIAISIVMLITMIFTYSRLVYIIFTLISIFYAIILLKKYNIKISKIINKKTILIMVILLITLVIYVIIGLQIPDELKVKNKSQKIIYNIQTNTDYNFAFDINATSDEKDNFVIEITERNIYLDIISMTEINFDNFNGRKEVNIHTQDETYAIYINIQNKNKSDNLKISKMYMNNEEVTLNYKILPTALVHKIQNISLNQKSLWQRAVYIRDGLKAIKDNWLFGLGGDAWRSVQLETQEYRYYAKEAHSFPIQIFLENGVIAFIAIIGISICIIKMLYKEIKNKDFDIVKLSSIIAIIFILLHSILDFDMSFLYVLLIVFLIIATLKTDDEIEKLKNNIAYKIIIILLILISIASIYCSAVELYYDNNKKKITVDEQKTKVQIFDTYSKLMPFNVEAKIKKYKSLEEEEEPNYKEIQKTLENIIVTEKYEQGILSLEYIKAYIDVSIKSGNNIDESLKLALECICRTEDFSKYKSSFQLYRLENLKEMVEILYSENKTEYANKFKEQFDKEITEKTENILDYKKGRYLKRDVSIYQQKINRLLQEQ